MKVPQCQEQEQSETSRNGERRSMPPLKYSSPTTTDATSIITDYDTSSTSSVASFEEELLHLDCEVPPETVSSHSARLISNTALLHSCGVDKSEPDCFIKLSSSARHRRQHSGAQEDPQQTQPASSPGITTTANAPYTADDPEEKRRQSLDSISTTPSAGGRGSVATSFSSENDSLEMNTFAKCLPSGIKNRLPGYMWKTVFLIAVESLEMETFTRCLPDDIKNRLPPDVWKTVLLIAVGSQNAVALLLARHPSSSSSSKKGVGYTGMGAPSSSTNTLTNKKLDMHDNEALVQSELGNSSASSPRARTNDLPSRSWHDDLCPQHLSAPYLPSRRVSINHSPRAREGGLPSRSWHDDSCPRHVALPCLPSRRGSIDHSAVLDPPRSGSATPTSSRPNEKQPPQITSRPSVRRVPSSLVLRTSIDGNRSDKNNPRNRKRRRVRFVNVFVRNYQSILDINPSTVAGPSIGLGWQYEEEPPMTIGKALRSKKNRPTRQLVLSRHYREHLVRDLGYTENAIAMAVRRSMKIKHQRMTTVSNLPHQKVEYLLEKSKRKVSNLLRFSKRVEY